MFDGKHLKRLLSIKHPFLIWSPHVVGGQTIYQLSRLRRACNTQELWFKKPEKEF